ncbi:MAG: hypothetical protein WA061_01685 [Microgenomates group bacterium]
MIIDKEMMKDLREELLSYGNIRDTLTEVLRGTKGVKRFHIKQAIEILDVAADFVSSSYHLEDTENAIYEILS